MTVSLIATPIITNSNVNAGLTQMRFQFQRIDLGGGAISFSDTGGFLTIIHTDVDPDPVVNDVVYVFSTGVYDDIGKITVVTSNIQFTTDIPFVSTVNLNSILNFITGFTGYSIDVQIFNSLGALQLIDDTFVYVPNQKGLLTIDVSSIIQTLHTDTIDVSIVYTLKFGESFGGAPANPTTISADVQSIYAVLPIGEVNGANMFVNLLATTPPAKWLTKFENPRLYPGWKSGSTSIMDSTFLNRGGGADGFQLDVAEFDVNKVKGPFTDVAASSDLTVRMLEFDFNSIRNTDFFQGRRIRAVDLNTTLSDTLLMIVTQECPQAIMVEWLNELGGFEQFMFAITQSVILSSTEGLTFEPVVDDNIATVQRQFFRINANRQQRITMEADDLTQIDISALHGIKTSDAVRVFLTKDGVDFIGVTVSSGFGTEYVTEGITGNFVLSLDFPENYDFFATKKY